MALTKPRVEPFCCRTVRLCLDENDVSANGYSPLMTATAVGHKFCVRKLIDRGGDLDAHNNRNSYPIILAIMYGEDVILSRLLRAGANVMVNGPNGCSPAVLAVDCDNHLALELLLMYEADANEPDSEGRTPLFLAAEKDCITCVNILIKNGASADGISQNGLSVFLISVKRNNVLTAEYLLPRVANIDQQDVDGTTALMMCVERKDYQLQQALLKKGANPNIKNNRNVSVLMMAVDQNDVSGVNLLLSFASVNINIRGNADLNVLEKYILRNGHHHDNMVTKLYGAGVMVNRSRVCIANHEMLRPCTNTLYNICIGAMRKHLLSSKPNVSLFSTIPTLLLPERIKQHVLNLHHIPVTSDDDDSSDEMSEL